MRNLVCQFALAPVLLCAISLPIPAAAEVRAQARCSVASWAAIAAGECEFDALRGAVPAPHDAEAGNIELLDFPEVPGIPEPGTYALMLAGLAAVSAFARSRKRL